MGGLREAGMDDHPAWRLRRVLGWVTLAAVVAAVVVAVVRSGLWADARSATASPTVFRAWVEGYGAWAPAVFFLAQVAQVVAAPIPGSIFPPVGAVAFGPPVALALSLAGSVTGSALVFAAGRRWGRPMAVRLVGAESLERYAGIAAGQGGLWLFAVYLLPLLPDDAVSAVAGLSEISLRRFVAMNVLGRLPGTVLAVYAASALLDQPAWVWLAGGALAVGALALAASYRSRLEAWLMERTGGRARR